MLYIKFKQVFFKKYHLQALEQMRLIVTIDIFDEISSKKKKKFHKKATGILNSICMANLLHLKGLSLWWHLECDCKFDSWLNAFSHPWNLHLYGFSPVCVLICCCRCESCVNWNDRKNSLFFLKWKPQIGHVLPSLFLY